MNRKLVLSLFFILTLSVSAFAQDSKTFAVNSFNNVKVSSGIDLYLTKGDTEGLLIKASDELLKNVEVVQDGQGLTIRMRSNFNWGRMFRNQTVKAYLSYKTLVAITASGGSDVFTQNTLNTTTLSLKASGGADLKLDVVCKDLTVQISGGADADLTGSAENLDVKSSGGSDFNGFNLKVVNAKVAASGGSDANVNVSKALEASASGGGDISYKGNPSVKKNSSVSGDVRRVN